MRTPQLSQPQGFKGNRNTGAGYIALLPELVRLVPIAAAIWLIGGGFGYYFIGGDEGMGLVKGTGVYNLFLVVIAVSLPMGIYLVINFRKLLALIESNPIVLIFLLYIALSNFWANDKLAAKNITELYFVSYIIACFCSIALKPVEILKVIFIMGLLSVFLSILWVALHHDLAVYTGSIFPGQWKGVYVHKNRLGQNVGIFLPLVLIWSKNILGEKFHRPLMIFVLAASLLVLAKAGSATAFMIAFCGLATWYAGQAMRRAQKSNRVLLALGAVIFIPLVVLFGPDLLLTVLGRDATLTGRTEIWAVLFNKFLEGNVWIGAGVGETYSSSQRAAMEQALGYAFDAHNGYITLLVELGFIGLVLALLMAGIGLYQGYNSAKYSREEADAKYVFVSLIFSWLAAMCVESSPAVGSNSLLMIGLISIVALSAPRSVNGPTQGGGKAGPYRGRLNPLPPGMASRGVGGPAKLS